jgi:hypothetical protein
MGSNQIIGMDALFLNDFEPICFRDELEDTCWTNRLVHGTTKAVDPTI